MNEEVGNKRKEIEGKNDEILQKKAEIVKLQKELEAAQKGSDEGVMRRLEQMMKINAELENQVKGLNEALEKARKEGNKEILRSNSGVESKVEESKDEGGNPEAANKMLRRTLTQMKINKDRERQENLNTISSLEQKNKVILDQIQVLKLEVADLKAKLNEKEKLVNRLKNLNIDTNDGYLKIKQILSSP